MLASLANCIVKCMKASKKWRKDDFEPTESNCNVFSLKYEKLLRNSFWNITPCKNYITPPYMTKCFLQVKNIKMLIEVPLHSNITVLRLQH